MIKTVKLQAERIVGSSSNNSPEMRKKNNNKVLFAVLKLLVFFLQSLEYFGSFKWNRFSLKKGKKKHNKKQQTSLFFQ